MAKQRTYKLLCPIARALDKLGDRWTLLILRDLHAGPARFGELATGLPGLASNLLTTRLESLQTDGLVVRQPGSGNTKVYALTEAGARTGSVLFELAAFGAQWPPPEPVRRPGNLRTVVVTLREALRRVVTDLDELHLELVVDDEAFGLAVTGGKADVTYGAAPDAPASIRTDYEALIAVGDGRMAADAFVAGHIEVLRGDADAAGVLMALLGRAFAA